jgi:hypothetical protein
VPYGATIHAHTHSAQPQPPVELPCRMSRFEWESESATWGCCLWVASAELAAAYVIYKPKPNFQIATLPATFTLCLSTARNSSYRPGSPRPDQPCKSRAADNPPSCFFLFFFCSASAMYVKVPCMWSSQPPILPIQTKSTLPDIPSRLMSRLSSGFGELRSTSQAVI